MNHFPHSNSPRWFVEVAHDSMEVSDGRARLKLALVRQENGRLTVSCKEDLVIRLKGFLEKQGGGGRARAVCAIGARGVSLRRFELPASSTEELPKLLGLQIEHEFPLAPEELAWGYRPLPRDSGSLTAGTPGQEVLVVAVKREVIEEYAEILDAVGITPLFTVAGLARGSACPAANGSYGVLDVGSRHSELTVFEEGVPSALRVLPWGRDHLARSLEEGLNLRADEAERLLSGADAGTPANGDPIGRDLQSVLQGSLRTLAGPLQAIGPGRTLYLAGDGVRLKELAPTLANVLGNGIQCERIDVGLNGDGSAAIAGLRKSWERDGGQSAIVLQAKAAKRAHETAARPRPWNWAVAAILLGLACFGFRYVEAVFRMPRLERNLARVRSQKSQWPRIDPELNFLRHLETNQAPYLNLVGALAESAPPGLRLESLSMNRGGDLSLRGTLQNGPQATDFRTKLIESGWFHTVVVQEQTPSADRQKVTVRIGAQSKPTNSREGSASESPGRTAAATNSVAPKAMTNPPATTNPPTAEPPGSEIRPK